MLQLLYLSRVNLRLRLHLPHLPDVVGQPLHFGAQFLHGLLLLVVGLLLGLCGTAGGVQLLVGIVHALVAYGAVLLLLRLQFVAPVHERPHLHAVDVHLLLQLAALLLLQVEPLAQLVVLAAGGIGACLGIAYGLLAAVVVGGVGYAHGFLAVGHLTAQTAVLHGHGLDGCPHLLPVVGQLVLLGLGLGGLHQVGQPVACALQGLLGDGAAPGYLLHHVLVVGLEALHHHVGLGGDGLYQSHLLGIARVAARLQVVEPLLHAVHAGTYGLDAHVLDVAHGVMAVEFARCLHATGVVLHRGVHVLQVAVQPSQLLAVFLQCGAVVGHVAEGLDAGVHFGYLLVQFLGMRLQSLHRSVGHAGVYLESYS